MKVICNKFDSSRCFIDCSHIVPHTEVAVCHSDCCNISSEAICVPVKENKTEKRLVCNGYTRECPTTCNHATPHELSMMCRDYCNLMGRDVECVLVKEEKKMSHNTIHPSCIKNMFLCVKSLETAISEAGGGYSDTIMDQLETMTAMELIELIAPNNIRFIYTKEK